MVGSTTAGSHDSHRSRRWPCSHTVVLPSSTSRVDHNELAPQTMGRQTNVCRSTARSFRAFQASPSHVHPLQREPQPTVARSCILPTAQCYACSTERVTHTPAPLPCPLGCSRRWPHYLIRAELYLPSTCTPRIAPPVRHASWWVTYHIPWTKFRSHGHGFPGPRAQYLRWRDSPSGYRLHESHAQLCDRIHGHLARRHKSVFRFAVMLGEVQGDVRHRARRSVRS